MNDRGSLFSLGRLDAVTEASEALLSLLNIMSPPYFRHGATLSPSARAQANAEGKAELRAPQTASAVPSGVGLLRLKTAYGSMPDEPYRSSALIIRASDNESKELDCKARGLISAHFQASAVHLTVLPFEVRSRGDK